MNQIKQGDVCHKIDHHTLCPEDKTAIKKFMKRQGRPNTAAPAKIVYNGAPVGQYRTNQAKLAEVDSKVEEYIKKPISLYDETKAWHAERDRTQNARTGAFNNVDSLLGPEKKKKKGPVAKVVKDRNCDAHEYMADMGQEEKAQKVISVAALGLRANHHLLTATVKYNTNRLISDVKEGRGAGDKNRIRFG